MRFLIFTILIFAFTAEVHSEPAGIFKTIEGDVELVHDGERRVPKVGQVLTELDRIKTGANSGAALTLIDGSVVSIGAKSIVSFETIQYKSSDQTGHLSLNILIGVMRMITGNLGKNQPEHVKIRTPTAVIGVRGTDFIVDVTDTPAYCEKIEHACRFQEPPLPI